MEQFLDWRTFSQHKPKIYLDLDGVFADLFPYIRAILKKEYREVSKVRAWTRLSFVPHLFRELPVIPGSLELFHALQHHGKRLEVLTALPLPTGFLVTAASDKRAWVAENLSADLVVHTILGGHNKYQYAAPGDVLIDDTLRNIEAWRKAGGIGILHRNVEDTLAQLRSLGLLET